MKTARRQIMLLLIFAAIAYGWWQTSVPSRYAEMPMDPDPLGVLPVPPGLESSALLKVVHSAEEWIYSNAESSLSVGWEAAQSQVQVYIRKTRPGAPVQKLEARMRAGYYPEEITFRSVAGESYRLAFDLDSVDIFAPQTERVRVPFPAGALFEDLICFQAMAWYGLKDTVRSQMVSLVEDAIPIRSFPIVIRPINDTTVELSTDTRHVTITYDSMSPRVRRFCAEGGLCANATPPYEK